MARKRKSGVTARPDSEAPIRLEASGPDARGVVTAGRARI